MGVDALLATLAEGDGKPAPASEAKKPEAPAPKDSGKGAGESIEIMVPTLGESVSEATVSTWFKAVGDSVTADEMLCELETDKVSVEVPSPAAGTLTEILAGEGDTVQAGGKLALMSSGDGAAAPAKSEEAPAQQGTSRSTESSAGKDVEDAPSAKKAMAEKGVSRDQVEGSGRDGRVMKEDVAKAGAAAKADSAPAAAEAPPGPCPRTGAGRARALPGRGRGSRGTGPDDPPAPDHRQAPQGQPEHRRHAHHL